MENVSASITKNIEAFIYLAMEKPCYSDDELVSALQSFGIIPTDAEKIVAFTPIAFAQHHLTSLGQQMPSFAVVRDSDREKEVRIKLSEQPYYVAASEIASRLFEGTDQERRRAKSIVERSAEWNAFSQLNGHRSTEGLVWSEPYLLRIPPEEFETGNRKWWRFW